MSNTLAGNLSRQKIQQLFAAVGSRPTEQTQQIQAAEYNWHQPHYFNSEQLKKLDDFAKKFATAVASKFACFCQSDFDVTITSITQHFAAEFLNQPPDTDQSYFLSFGADDHPAGMVIIPPQTATVWTTQLLGDSASEENTGRKLSQLEESLLLDIACSIVETLSGMYKAFNFRPDKNVIKGQRPLELQNTKEVCKITFSVKKAGSENFSEAHLLILCSELEPAAGKAVSVSGDGLSAQEVSKAILEHLQQIQVCVTVQLASDALTFDQILNLQTDDILVLNKRIDEPIELRVDGRTIWQGWPAKSEGCYAVVIKERDK